MSYPKYRKPTAKVTCDICGKIVHARGLIPHKKLAHGIIVTEVSVTSGQVNDMNNNDNTQQIPDEVTLEIKSIKPGLYDNIERLDSDPRVLDLVKEIYNTGGKLTVNKYFGYPDRFIVGDFLCTPCKYEEKNPLLDERDMYMELYRSMVWDASEVLQEVYSKLTKLERVIQKRGKENSNV